MNTTTAPAPPAAPSTPAAHEHGWTTESAHRTSAGTVRRVHVKQGDHVKAGDVLVEIEA